MLTESAVAAITLAAIIIIVSIDLYSARGNGAQSVKGLCWQSLTKLALTNPDRAAIHGLAV